MNDPLGAHRRRPTLAVRLARIALGAAFATVQMWAGLVLGDSPLGWALIIMAGWNAGLVLVGLISLREASSPKWGEGTPR
ncbi:MAG: hypothetical protein K0R62_7877 [Nonomuraea muscovyensis]|jgi:hypothetical protein|nr:hypothetical protein [Nonomuraea muscovyensis]